MRHFIAGDATRVSIQQQEFEAVDGVFSVPDHFEKHMTDQGFKPGDAPAPEDKPEGGAAAAAEEGGIAGPVGPRPEKGFKPGDAPAPEDKPEGGAAAAAEEGGIAGPVGPRPEKGFKPGAKDAPG
jgi:hypothetical protein